MKFINIFALILVFNLKTQDLFAEKFLGEVKPEDLEQAEEETSDPSTSFWSFSLGIGGSLNSYQASFSSKYNYSKWVAPEARIAYAYFKDDDLVAENSSLEIPLILYLANPTLFWPYVGAGPGYERWSKNDKFGSIDDTYSLTGFHLVGAQFRFSKSFGLMIEQKTRFYVNNQPVRKIINRGLEEEEKIYEKQIVQQVSANFYVSF